MLFLANYENESNVGNPPTVSKYIHFAFCRLMFPQITRHLKIVCCSYERSEYIIFYTSLSKHLNIVYLVKRKSYLFLNQLFYLYMVPSSNPST